MQNEITTCINVLNLLISCQSHHHKRISFYEIHSLVFTCVVRIRVVFINYGTFDKMQNFDKGKSRDDFPTGCYGLWSALSELELFVNQLYQSVGSVLLFKTIRGFIFFRKFEMDRKITIISGTSIHSIHCTLEIKLIRLVYFSLETSRNLQKWILLNYLSVFSFFSIDSSSSQNESGNVKISHPVFVIAIVCSNWADRELSLVTAVHSSDKILNDGFPKQRIGSIVNVTPAIISPS